MSFGAGQRIQNSSTSKILLKSNNTGILYCIGFVCLFVFVFVFVYFFLTCLIYKM